MALFDGKYMNSYLTAIVMFALSLTIYEIFANEIKFQKCDLENEGQVLKVKKEKDGTCTIRLRMVYAI